MRNEDYIVICGWMKNELHLTGTALLIYAMIFSFTKDCETEYYGSLSYICGWLGVGRSTAIRTLSELTERGFLVKRSELINGVSYNRYRVSYPFTGGGVKTTPGVVSFCSKGSVILTPNNTKIIQEKKEIYKERNFTPPTIEEVKAYCEERKNGIDPEAFIAFYESKGWLVGKSPMRSWKAAIITWEKNRENPEAKEYDPYGLTEEEKKRLLEDNSIL